MSVQLARRGAIASSAFVLPSAPYNIAWANSVWAGDSSWTNPGDGNPVDSMRNPSGGGDPAATSTNRPTYRASVATYNNQPGVQFVRANSQRLDVDITDVAQPYSLVVVGNTSGTANGPERLVGIGNNTSRGMGDISSPSNSFAVNAATSLVGSTTNASPHLFRFYANDTSSVLAIDGTTVASGAAGTNPMARFTLGVGSNATPTFADYLEGYIVFAAVIAGDVASNAEWVNFKSWVATTYGLTIA